MKQFAKPSEIKVGVIGYGGAFNMGKKHLEEMKLAGMKPFAVCEIDPARLDVAQADFPGIETYGNLESMLKNSDVDLIVHITPHNLHFKLAAQCVEAGKHVVTEKPFVVTTAEADKLIALAKKKKVMVSTYHNRHWDGIALRAKQQIADKGIVGDVFRIEMKMGGYGMPREWWRTSKTISGGVLYDWGVHLLEYALQVMPGKLTEVSGYARNGYWESQAPKNWPWKNDTNEDSATAIARFDHGGFIQLCVGQLESYTDPYIMKVFGTQGCYLASHGQWVTRIPDKKGDMVQREGRNPKGEGERFYQNIAKYLCGKQELIITPQWARRPIHILDLADQSAKQGKAIKAKYA